jgi:hypothetical protein
MGAVSPIERDIWAIFILKLRKRGEATFCTTKSRFSLFSPQVVTGSNEADLGGIQ